MMFDVKEATSSERAMEYVAHQLEETYEEDSQLLSLELVTYRAESNG